ncbi:MAG: MurR/RpiR family transcriptional regulator [Turicibacter sanguinis]|uniref:SIS domain-containing protein n=4 Tax=Turicibacter sanguinis TaxID=154288 RepID=A0A9X5AMY8_9FIRM|nr:MULTISPECIES: MurR/RpiR family transcriptional regulator [Turicibacter]EFF63652.1 SIS domain protein [Turicibacter sanguinis PC909]EGC92218.1 SIS domain protein [Turicibacter sp. HGF1]MCU7189882.1 MurR/RpiR family transcriptional regulator [Turicibacter sanguinis]MCU7196966.1 MurR/RpiR family transcriptional regulator [Turicibacter sanguinis]MCU7200962.1 MurR/RpiR family transcriptional regulator [Turicibacter sanguinis]
MFNYEQIKKFTDVEILIYNYIMQNSQNIRYMTIRELADAVHVSTSAIMRFCKKLDCEGYAEFKVQFKMHLEEIKEKQPLNDISEIIHYFQSVNNEEFEQNISQVAQLVSQAKQIIFVGIGTSGILGKYGARYFSNIGKFSYFIDDPFYPNIGGISDDAVVIMLSVSGETEQTLNLARFFLQQRCTLVSITNSTNSTLAKMSQYNLSYYMTNQKNQKEYDITTQVPVVFILESIGRRLTLNA